jgi:hypothetical protein
MNKQPILELTQVFENEAKLLIAARDRCRAIHTSGDIDASGDEVEVAVREFLGRKLPAKYYVGHGHIVDKTWKTSPQIDVIVADNSATPILFETDNGTQYFPYESVYLIGEVKASYAKSKGYISTFAETCRKVKDDLRRTPTPQNYIGNGYSVGEGMSINVQEPFRNPVFSFMIFLDSGDMSKESLLKEFALIPDQYLPNIICFADGAIVTKFHMIEKGRTCQVGSLDADCHHILQNDDLFWVLNRLTDPAKNKGQSLSVLMMCIFEHLRTCVLLSPPITDYLSQIVKDAPNKSEAIDMRLAVRMAGMQGTPLESELVNFVEEKRMSEREYHGKLSADAKE